MRFRDTLPWLLGIPLPRRLSDKASRRHETRRVELSAVDVGRTPGTSRIAKPNTYQPLDHEPLDGERLRGLIAAEVQSLDGALDEFTPDAMDGLIDAWRAQWDAAAERKAEQRMRVSLDLLAEERHALAETTEELRRVRSRLAAADHNAAQWRAVLIGASRRVDLVAPERGLPEVTGPSALAESRSLRDLLDEDLSPPWTEAPTSGDHPGRREASGPHHRGLRSATPPDLDTSDEKDDDDASA